MVLYFNGANMAVLTAHFKIMTPSVLVIEGEENQEYSYELTTGEYSIKITFSAIEYGPKSGRVGSDIYKQLVNTIEISISKEVGDIPEIPKTEKGGRDYSKITSYFEELRNGYEALAKKYYIRLLSYFKFDLHQPFLDLEYINENEFSNPIWSDSNGVDYGIVRGLHHAEAIPGMHGDCMDITTLTVNDKESLINALKTDKDVELFQQMMSDAQSAILNGDLRRAVFELAVTCELVTKRKYFSENNISGFAFDYFEDKGKVKITVNELITNVASEVLGESFNSYSSIDCKNIDYLFRCRNKVAHRGHVIFKDDSGNLHSPDVRTLKEWYLSVCKLIDWLKSKQI